MDTQHLIELLIAALASAGVFAWFKRRAIRWYRYALKELGLTDSDIDRAIKKAQEAEKQKKIRK